MTVLATAPIHNLWTAEHKYSPHPIIVFLRARVEMVETGCSIDRASVFIDQQLYPHPVVLHYCVVHHG